MLSKPELAGLRSQGFAESASSRDTEFVLLLSLCVLFILLLSTVDAVWLDRGSFSGAGTFDVLAGVKLGARGIAVGFGAWLFLQVGPGSLPWRDPGLRLLVIFLVYAGATSLYSAQPILSLTRSVSFLGILFFAVVLVGYFAQAGRFEEFWDGLFLTLGLFVTAVFLASLALDAAGVGAVNASWDRRLSSLYGPNGAASLGGLAFIWSFVRLTQGVRTRWALFFLASSGALLVLALSRGALITVVLTCVGYALWRRKGFMWLTVMVGLGGLVVALAQVAGSGVSELAEFFTRGHSVERIQAMNGRIPLYGYLLFEQFPEYPIFGVGFQMLSETGVEVDIPDYIAVQRGSWLPGHAHNALLQVLIGTGLLGLLLYLAAVISIGKGLIGRVRLAAPQAYEALIPLSVFLVANSMIETTLTGTIDPNYILAVLIVATVAATYPPRGVAA